MSSFRVSRSSNPLLISSLCKERWAERPRDVREDRNRNAAFDLPLRSTESSNASAVFGPLPTRWSCEPRSSCGPTSIPIGVTWRLPERWAVPTGRYVSGAVGAGRDRHIKTLRGQEGHAFFPSAIRARVTALACTLPRASGKPLSRWSAGELARTVIQRGIVSNISASTVKRWLHADQIKPWQYRNWQQPTDPRFLEKAIPILELYERAQSLSRKGHIIVCADEKTSIQARKAEGSTSPAGRGHAVRVGDRYQRRGAVQLFAGLLVHKGETLARCFAHKRFREFQTFLQMLFASLWCRRIRVLHLILDNGSTHAPKQAATWIDTLGLPFTVRLHWLPVHASWLDQIEIVFSILQRKVLMPNDFASPHHVERHMLAFLAERNRTAQPIHWSYTSKQLMARFGRRQRLAAS
jgi:DDE superfamily endonuclease